MSLEQKILERAIAATGDEDIFLAGDFLPSDFTLNQFSESSLGPAADEGAWGSSREETGRLPLVVMAVSPANLYLLVTPPGEGIFTADRFDLVETIDRGTLQARSAERDTVHIIIIEDVKAIREFTLVGVHAGSHSINEVLEELGR